MSIYSILSNMYYNGDISSEGNNMQFVTKNNDYKIIMSRTPLEKNWQQSGQYMCKLLFKDNLDRDILCLEFNEISASIFLDNINAFYNETCIFDQLILSNIMSSDIFKVFNISIHTAWQEGYITHPKYTLLIEEINSYYKTTMPRISIEFDDESLDSFINAFFFINLIDIYEPEYM